MPDARHDDDGPDDRMECLDAVTLQRAWPVVMRAWRDRHRDPTLWRLIANAVVYCERSAEPRAGLGKDGA